MDYEITIIGESLNASIPFVKEAIIRQDDKSITDLAIQQAECGAHLLDVNAAVIGRNETKDLVWMVEMIQSVVNLPLVLDSSDPNALEAVMKIYNGPTPILSSITGEMTVGSEVLLSIAAEYDCGLVAMCLDNNGISQDPERRLSIAEKLYEKARTYDIKPENIYIDPLVMAVSADTLAGSTCLEVLRLIKQNLPKVHTFCGASNVSHGMPSRKLLNHTFISMLAAFGMDCFMVDVRDNGLIATLLAAAVLVGKDEWSMQFLKAYRSGLLNVKK